MSDPAKYRTKEELESYKAQDPIEQVRKTIFSKKLATPEDLAEIDKGIKEKIAVAVKFAEESPYPEKKEVYTDVYVEDDYPYTMD